MLDNLKIAKKKANKAKTTNDLSSHNEDIKSKRKRNKQRAENKNRNKRFSDTDTSLDDDSSDGNNYPVTSFLNIQKTNNSEKTVNGKYYYL